mmetsp:Transcript_8544/g.27238  ORF Transcript_8544/g.27238 Transcript_8544/m.27238 type:complete len:230 (+) Transcript_8544:343-1032(+)
MGGSDVGVKAGQLGTLQVTILVRKGHSLGHLELLFVLANLVDVQVHLGRRKRGRLDERELRIADQLASEPQKRLLKVVVGLGTDIVVLQVLLTVKGDGLRLHFSVLHVDLVAHEDNGDVLAHTHQITMPVGHRLVRQARRDIEHNDGTLALDVVPVAEATKLLLSGGVPHMENNLTPVGHKVERVHLNAERCHVFLLKFASYVALDKGGLSGTTVTDKNELKSGNVRHA